MEPSSRPGFYQPAQPLHFAHSGHQTAPFGHPGPLRINALVEESIVDGPGLRFVVFTQGCLHHCKGCHNPHTHDPEAGYQIDTLEILRQFSENPLLAGITLSGGEPFLQPGPLVWLAAQVRQMGKNVVTFTGFVYEKLLLMSRERPEIGQLIELSDLLVDGPYLEEMRNLELQYRGSSNQRVLSLRDRAALSPGWQAAERKKVASGGWQAPLMGMPGLLV